MNIIKPENALKFILGGKARFVLWNKETGNRFEYRIFVRKSSDTTFNVYGDRLYLGAIHQLSSGLEFHKNEELPLTNIALQAFTWYVRRLLSTPISIPENVVMYHLGHCCVCGRELKDPVSVELGIGPICRG